MRRALLSLAASALVALPLGAQATDPGGAYFRLFAGANLPTGDMNDFYNPSFRGGGTIGWQLAGIPLAFDLDVAYDHLRAEDFDFAELDNGSIISGTVNARWNFVPQGGGSVSGFVSGGVGAYRIKQSGEVPIGKFNINPALRLGVSTIEIEDSSTEFGFNLGAGVMFGTGRTQPFIRGQWHSIRAEGEAANYVTADIGIQFRAGQR